ncbi:MAG: hypothetical protein HYW57_09880 [Ignavibacteriales bacterium]|nr:hypothetical protein [Ignavibacteriales bacterium]
MKRLEPGSLEDLIQLLRQEGYTVIAPTVRDSAIVYDEVSSSGELPNGWTDHQTNASYKLQHGEQLPRIY